MAGPRARASRAAALPGTPAPCPADAPREGDGTGASGEAERTADRLHSVAIHLLRRLRREDTKTGLSAPRLSALSVVVFGGPVTLGALAAAEQVRPPTMTRLVTALEAAGLVTREPDPGDGRLTRIRATAKGRTLLLRGRARRVAALTDQLRALGESERAALDRAVTILQGVIDRLR
jgi:DNA-binding MarR family transcriptional regulator